MLRFKYLNIWILKRDSTARVSVPSRNHDVPSGAWSPLCTWRCPGRSLCCGGGETWPAPLSIRPLGMRGNKKKVWLLPKLNIDGMISKFLKTIEGESNSWSSENDRKCGRWGSWIFTSYFRWNVWKRINTEWLWKGTGDSFTKNIYLPVCIDIIHLYSLSRYYVLPTLREETIFRGMTASYTKQ